MPTNKAESAHPTPAFPAAPQPPGAQGTRGAGSGIPDGDACENAARWYAVRCMSGRESRVAAALERGGIESYLPAVAVAARYSDRVKTRLRPLFCGYLFARFERRAEQAAVLAVTGTLQIVGHDEFDSISDDDIASVRRIVESPARVSTDAHVVGKRVRIKCGYFTDCVGVVVRTRGKVRLVVSLEMLGKSVSVELDSRDCKPEAA